MWALAHIVEKAFPKYVRWNHTQTADDVVAVQMHRHSDNFLKHVHVDGAEPKWWLEGSSYPIRVVDPRRVDVLISSREMKEKYGEAPIAVRFRDGDGVVVHITSHFYLQRADLRTARDKAGADGFVADLEMDEATTASLAGKARSGGVKTGEVASAYAMQQMSVNVLVSKKKENEKLMEDVYDHVMTAGAPLLGAPGGASTGQEVEEGWSVKVLGESGQWIRVQNLFGHQGWVISSLVRKK